MITDENAYNILELERSATVEEIAARYQMLKDQYNRMKDAAADLKTRLACQLKQIELDDAFIYFSNKQRV